MFRVRAVIRFWLVWLSFGLKSQNYSHEARELDPKLGPQFGSSFLVLDRSRKFGLEELKSWIIWEIIPRILDGNCVLGLENNFSSRILGAEDLKSWINREIVPA